MNRTLLAILILLPVGTHAQTTRPATTRAATTAASDKENAAPRASGVDVTIQSAKLEYLVLHRVLPKPDPEDLVSNQSLLIVRVQITNKGQKDVTYNSFNGAPAGRGEDRAALALSNRRMSALVNFGDLEPVGVTRTATLKPGESVTDLLAFGPPPDGAKPATLFLPAKNHGGVGLWKLAVKMDEEAANPLEGK